MHEKTKLALGWAKDRKPDGVTDSGIEFYGLPRELWRPFADALPTGLGPCCCRYCSKDGRSRNVAAWDTLGVQTDRYGNVLQAWHCHGPEFRNVRAKRKNR